MTDQNKLTPIEQNSQISSTISYNKQILIDYFNRITNFKPRTLLIKEFSPLLQPELSVPCLIGSLIIGRYYRQRYFLIKASTIRIFSVGLNYAILYYLVINGIELYNHLQKNDHIKTESNNI
jgi:hypothetical protein